MKILNLIFLGGWIILCIFFVWRVIGQLVSGKLAGRGGNAVASRSENASVYWRKMTVEMMMAAAMVSLLIMAFGSLVH